MNPLQLYKLFKVKCAVRNNFKMKSARYLEKIMRRLMVCRLCSHVEARQVTFAIKGFIKA